LTWSKPAGTGLFFWLLRHFNWRNTQKMALNMAKTTGNPTGNPTRNASHPGTDMDRHIPNEGTRENRGACSAPAAVTWVS
jgi:hypothetical protein